MKTRVRSGDGVLFSTTTSNWQRVSGAGRLWLAGMVLAAVTGCTLHTQTQYFAVKDPNTGAANYYRLSISGCGNLTKYNLQAGYYSAAAVDILRGRMPDVPELDLPIEQADVYDQLRQHIGQNLIQQAHVLAPITNPSLADAGLRSRMEQERLEQARVEAELAKTQASLAPLTNNAVQAATKVDQAKQQIDQETNAVALADQEVKQATAAATAATAALKSSTTMVSELRQATHPTLPAGANLTMAEIAPGLTNLYTIVNNIKDATNACAALLGSQVASLATNLDSQTLKQAQSAVFSVSNAIAAALGTNTTLASAITNLSPTNALVLLTNLATNVVVVAEVTTAVSNGVVVVSATNVAKAQAALDTARKGLAIAEADLAKANQAQAAAQTAKAGLDDKLVVLQTRLTLSRASETNTAGAIMRLEAQYPDSALGLDSPKSATNSYNLPDDPEKFMATYINLARLFWLSSLSGMDVAAVGMNQTLDPFQFRKLVFWNKSTSLNMDQAAGDVDTVMDQVVQIGRSFKQVGQDKKAAAAKAQAEQANRATAAIDALKSLTQQKTVDPAVLTNVIKMLVPGTNNPAPVQP